MTKRKKCLMAGIGILSVFLMERLSMVIFIGIFGSEANLSESTKVMLRFGLVSVLCVAVMLLFATVFFKISASPPPLSSNKRRSAIILTAVCIILSVIFLSVNLYNAATISTFYSRFASGDYFTFEPISALCEFIVLSLSRIGAWLLKFMTFFAKNWWSDIRFFISSYLPFYIFAVVLFGAIYGIWRIKKSSDSIKHL